MHELSKKDGCNRPSASAQDKTQKTFGPEIVKLKLALWTLLAVSDLTLKFFALKYFQPEFNSGVSFGIGENVPLWLIVVVFTVLLLMISRGQIKAGELLLLAGGAGNILDRLVYGKIVDWIRFGSLWFNLADAYIFLGVVLIAYEYRYSFRR